MTRLRRIVVASPDGPAALAALCRREVESTPAIEAQVRAILDDVRTRGDDAVRAYTERFDGRPPRFSGVGGAAIATYELPREAPREALARLPAATRAALEHAAARVTAFHRPQGATSYGLDGGRLELRARPLARVGLYAPGGTARYPSSVLMTAIPARLAGVDEIVLCTPGASDETLAAAHLSGVHRVFELGGAQAIAAMAYGTATVPRVDKIVGPGNSWVAVAKRLVFGAVDIDSIAGPSEVMIVADASADPAWIAADLLAQAEHDVEARAILVTPVAALVAEVEAALAAQLADLPRAAIAGEAIARHGVAVVVGSIEEALAVADAYAPEHLELVIERARDRASALRNAGAIFVGGFSPEAAGDYLAGPNHVLPTGGAARYASPLGVYDFVKHTSVLALDAAALAEIADDIEHLASVEGLDAHGRSVAIRRAALPRSGVAVRPAVDAAPPGWRALVRDELAAVRPYRIAAADRPAPVVAKLDANEHPFGLPPELAAELATELATVDLHRYPDIEARELRAAVADELGVAGDRLLIGNGSDDVIRLLCSTFARPRAGAARAAIAYPWPSFAMFPAAVRAAGCRPVELPLRPDFTLDVAAVSAVLAATRPNLCFLARPNNPTGTLWSSRDVEALAAGHPDVLFVSDEAYAAYATDSMIGRLDAVANLVVLQTLSKIGLAALRVGFLIAPPALVAEVEKVRGPYDVGALNQRAARWALLRCRELMRSRCALVIRERARVSEALTATAGLSPYASEANFVLFRVDGGDVAAESLWQALAARGVAVKHFAGPGPLAGHLRVTIGTPPENDLFLTAVSETRRRP